MLEKIKKTVGKHLVNIPGWRTDRKIVVIESDDWGSIRMPSQKAYKKLLEKGIRVDNSIYDKYDILEQRKDLESLFDLFTNHKDVKGNYPIFTFNTVMGNPDFKRIKEDKFDQYHHEDIEISYEKYNGDNILDLWGQAIDEGLIYPQFHAKEHLNVSLWMEALRKNYYQTRVAFDYNFFGLKTETPSPHQKNYLAAYWAESEHDFSHKLEILKKGFRKFNRKFGFPSKSFVACNYIFPEEMEKKLSELGVKYIQSQRGHISPDIATGDTNIKRHFTGQDNSYNQIYMVRNCSFEPTFDGDNIDSVNTCLNEIETAFRWNKPAVISSHRINYVGGMDTENRDKNLKKLKKLLAETLKKWPSVEFMTSVELGKIIENNN